MEMGRYGEWEEIRERVKVQGKGRKKSEKERRVREASSLCCLLTKS